MFILYAVAIGLVLGVILGGSVSRVGQLALACGGQMAAGLIVQLALFSAPVSDRIGILGAPIYVVSTAVVLAAVVMNWRLAGMPIVIVGGASNFLAIIANEGYMPADPAALAAAGHQVGGSYSNSILTGQAALRPLTDVFVLPHWLPFTNVFSVGDGLIGIGVTVVLVAAMTGRAEQGLRGITRVVAHSMQMETSD